jgi:hypothetical protein
MQAAVSTTPSSAAAAAASGSHQVVRMPSDDTPAAAAAAAAAARKQRRQEPLRVQLASWWEDWLSCGIKKNSRLQQQQQHQQQQQRQQWQQQRHCTVSHVPSHRQEQQQEQVCVKQQSVNSSTDGTVQSSSSSSSSTEQCCASCQQLLAALQCAGLSYLLAALPAGLNSAADDWGSVLSPGEMQRLGFARVLLHKPLLAVLDEATSSLPGEIAVQLYQQLQRAGVSYVSVGHSSSLLGVHGQVLSIAADGAGGWQLQSVQGQG